LEEEIVAEALESKEYAREFPLTTPEVAKDPGAYFETLRTECPVARSEAFAGFWILSRYDDVYNAALKPEVFSSSKGIAIPVIPQPPVVCIGQDDPEHRKYRRPMQGWFSVKRIQAIEDQVRGIVTSCIDEIIDDRKADLGEALASPIPPKVIALILGLPESEWHWFQEQEDALLRHAQEGNAEAAGPVYQAIAGDLARHVADRREHPRDDMLSDIVALTIDDEPISDDVAVSLAFLILGAGHETTVGGIGGLLYRVLKDPKLRDRLIADPALINNAVEEALRLESPLLGLGRFLLDDTVVEDVAMSQGDRVMLMWGAANRDPSVFDSPEEFRIDRENPQKHIAFGAGVHRCVGAPLARMEMRITLDEVLRRMPGARLVNDADVTVTWTMGRDFRHLDATW
jgi:cytochrome P450